MDATDVILLLGALSRVPAEWDDRAPTLVTVIVDGLRLRSAGNWPYVGSRDVVSTPQLLD